MSQVVEPTRNRRRRRAIAAVLIAVTIGGLAAGWWFLWVPNWRPPLQEGERYGIDVSSHQSEIVWEAVAGDDIEFAYVKATEGHDFVDEYFAANWRGAGKAELDRGAYHFFTLCTPGREQALNFLRVVEPDPNALPPAVDLELAGNCTARPSRADMLAELEGFLSEVEKAWEREALLYLGNDFESFYDVEQRLERALWVRRFLLRPTTDDWTIWQLHGYALVEGVVGGVDLNVMRNG